MVIVRQQVGGQGHELQDQPLAWEDAQPEEMDREIHDVFGPAHRGGRRHDVAGAGGDAVEATFGTHPSTCSPPASPSTGRKP